MRLFFALELDLKTRAALAQATADVRQRTEKGRWTGTEKLHVTVQFLGELPEANLSTLGAILQRSADAIEPFMLTFKGFGAFGSQKDILWIGIEHSEPLQTLFQKLTYELVQAGLPYENRPYRPHLTVARQVRLSGGQLPAWSMPPICCLVSQVSLMESTRLDGELQYRNVIRRELTGQPKSSVT